MDKAIELLKRALDGMAHMDQQGTFIDYEMLEELKEEIDEFIASNE